MDSGRSTGTLCYTVAAGGACFETANARGSMRVLVWIVRILAYTSELLAAAAIARSTLASSKI